MNPITEFQKAWENYPSQDNEGYVPDRGGFKCGFMAAWQLLGPARLIEMTADRDEWRAKAEDLAVMLKGVRAIREQAIEEAARLFDHEDPASASAHVARAIRKLKDEGASE